MSKLINGFSKLSKIAKIDWLSKNYIQDNHFNQNIISESWYQNEPVQKVLEGFSENTISNFHLPFGLAPNFLINGNPYCIPMAIEESSVVAAASAAAKYWLDRGGFHAKVVDTQKVGQVHFYWYGHSEKLIHHFQEIKSKLLDSTTHLTTNMVNRGGGILNIELLNKTAEEPNYYQLFVTFETCNSMGANFINTILESFAQSLSDFIANSSHFNSDEKEVKIIMSILSNYTPDCLAKAWVECNIEDLGSYNNMDANELAEKFYSAVKIAKLDPYRATTHNKGIFNGIDAVVIATGNDFRAVEACGHTYAARNGKYSSLSNCSIDNNIFRFELEIPLAIGTVGGLTKLHPMAQLALQILGNPSAKTLMEIIAVVGLAQNFAAVRSLVTSGIQKGHMKMHLGNILQQLGSTEAEKAACTEYFHNKVISHSAVRDFLVNSRQAIDAKC